MIPTREMISWTRLPCPCFRYAVNLISNFCSYPLKDRSSTEFNMFVDVFMNTRRVCLVTLGTSVSSCSPTWTIQRLTPGSLPNSILPSHHPLLNRGLRSLILCTLVILHVRPNGRTSCFTWFYRSSGRLQPDRWSSLGAQMAQWRSFNASIGNFEF